MLQGLEGSEVLFGINSFTKSLFEINLTFLFGDKAINIKIKVLC
jgi:hypothetical protein